MDDKNVYGSFFFFDKIFILNEIEKLERIYLPTIAFNEDTNMFSFEFEEVLVFDYGYTTKLLLTN